MVLGLILLMVRAGNQNTGTLMIIRHMRVDLPVTGFIQNWKPDLLIMRISENVTDASHNFAFYYKQVIDYLIQQNPSCKVILTTSVWELQADVSNYITGVGTERNHIVVNLNNITGAQAGTSGHPNDAAMQVIADRIWAGVQGTPPPPPPPPPPPRI